MLDYLLAACLVAVAAFYSIRSIVRSLRGKKACCDHLDECQLAEMVNNSEKGVKALKCHAETADSHRTLTGRVAETGGVTPAPAKSEKP